MKRTLIIIISYHCSKEILETIEKLAEEELPVIVVDNGSNPASIELLKTAAGHYGTEVIFNETNLGIAAALNQGVRYALENNYEWVLTLDQDSLVTLKMVETMVRVYESLTPDEKKRTAGLFATPIERAKAKPEDFVSDVENLNFAKVVVGITSGNILRTDVFNRVGFFDEKLFIDYVDHDFYLRLADTGFELLECPGAKLIHRRGNYTLRNIGWKKTATTNHAAFRQYYITRNRMYMWRVYRKNHPDFVGHDKKTFCKQLLKVLLVEDDKWLKIKMMVKGTMDCHRNCFGKLPTRD